MKTGFLGIIVALAVCLPALVGAQRTVVEGELQIDDRPPIAMQIIPTTPTMVLNPTGVGPAVAWSQLNFGADVDSSDLSIGPHALSIRVKDSADTFSDAWQQPPFGTTDRRTKQFFRVEGDQYLAAAEYFFPGVPDTRLLRTQWDSITGTPVPLPIDAAWDGRAETVGFDLPTADLLPGDYFVYTRFRDQDSNWSIWHEGSFSVAPPTALNAAEVVWEDSSGELLPRGFGIPMTFGAPDAGDYAMVSGQIDVFDFALFPKGKRPTLYVRSQNNLNHHIDYGELTPPAFYDRGRWSDAELTSVTVDRCPYVESTSPAESVFSSPSTQGVSLTAFVEDPDGDAIPPIRWTVNGEELSGETGQSVLVTPQLPPDATEVGQWTVTATVALGSDCESSTTWTILVVPCPQDEDCTGQPPNTQRLRDKILIIAGGGDYPDNGIADATRSLAEYAYFTAAKRGYDLGRDVKYLSAFPTIPAPTVDDPEREVPNTKLDGPATLVEVERAIFEWAFDARRLIIVMLDHGEIAANDTLFLLDGTTVPRQYLAASTLDEWLDETQSGGDPLFEVILYVDMCYAGGFIDKCRLPPNSRRTRYVIASTSSDRLASFGGSGGQLSFTAFFLASALNGSSLRDAFVRANQAMVSLNVPAEKPQRPHFDDDGDGLHTGLDGPLLSLQRLGSGPAFASLAPQIIAPEEDEEDLILTRTRDVQLIVETTGPTTRVLAYIQLTTASFDQSRPISSFIELNFEYNEETSRWEAIASRDFFPYRGTYSILYTAIGPDPTVQGLELQSVPVTLKIIVENGPSPVSRDGILMY
jgi:hypothetical protein